MTCPWRFLTADGRILACEQEHPFRATHFFRPAPGTAIETAPDSDDLCAWDATCLVCSGDGIEVCDGSTCPGRCDGTGIDETPPFPTVDGWVWCETIGKTSYTSERDYERYQCDIVGDPCPGPHKRLMIGPEVENG